ncbi:MAG: sensor domain-containing diguanylate cyclase [Acidobacteriota bacterium]|nr:sensor domain-containing diguanylate cyclase [Acidobacteriota bacterium]
MPVLIAPMLLLTAAFLTAASNWNFGTKISILIVLLVLWMLIAAVFHFYRRPKNIFDSPKNISDSPKNVFDDEVEAKLQAFDEARMFFGASLKSADMFRLVANRLNELIPFTTGVLLAADENKSQLTAQFAVGDNSGKFSDLKIANGCGIAGAALASGAAQLAETLSEDETSFAAEAFDKLQSGIAAPLYRETELFGVIALYGNAKNSFDQNSLELLKAAAVRVAPLLNGAQIVENNLNNALTDNLTALPNERAFYLVLENQIAEAQRYRGERLLTVLAFDIKNFSEINRKYGHITGDLSLNFIAGKIKAQLRQMDFLARSAGDDFLLILPTTTEETTWEIVERMEKILAGQPFEISGHDQINLQLNFGAASFWKDGETAHELVKCAILKKKQSKNAGSENKILFFPNDVGN